MTRFRAAMKGNVCNLLIPKNQTPKQSELIYGDEIEVTTFSCKAYDSSMTVWLNRQTSASLPVRSVRWGKHSLDSGRYCGGPNERIVERSNAMERESTALSPV